MMPTVPISIVKTDIALDMLRDCLGSSDGGAVIPGKHFRDELTKEGLSIPDAWYVLRKGCIYNPPRT